MTVRFSPNHHTAGQVVVERHGLHAKALGEAAHGHGLQPAFVGEAHAGLDDGCPRQGGSLGGHPVLSGARGAMRRKGSLMM